MANQFSLIHVLVVDDDPVHLDLVSRFLEVIGVRNFKTASDGIAALALLRSELFHVVLTDNKMPEMGGRQLVETIREDPFIRHLRMVMISACLEEDAELAHFLWQKNVLPVQKKHLDAEKVRRAIATVVGFDH